MALCNRVFTRETYCEFNSVFLFLMLMENMIFMLWSILNPESKSKNC
ncbi:hypothetical protein ECNG_05226, partial [Escherichia coli TA280]